MKTLLSKFDKEQIGIAISKELFQVLFYKDIANKLQLLGYFGAMKFFLKESEEEMEHYQKWVDYCNDRLDVATMPSIPAMDTKISNLGDALNAAMEKEQEVSDFYAKFMEDTDDEYTEQRLLFFIEVQKEAVGTYGDLIARFAIIGDDKCGALIFDQEMGK